MKKIIAFVGGVIFLFSLFLVFHQDILAAYARALEVNDATKGADAIVVLGGSALDRTEAAIGLYQKGYTGKVLLTSPKRYISRYYPFILPDGFVSEMILKHNGVPYGLIPSLKEGATSTFDEAYDFAAYLQKHPMEKVILVTSRYQTYRARYAFLKVLRLYQLGDDVKVEMYAAPNEHFDSSNWWFSEAGLSAYITEGMKTLLYFLITQNLEMVEESQAVAMEAMK